MIRLKMFLKIEVIDMFDEHLLCWDLERHGDNIQAPDRKGPARRWIQTQDF